VDVAFVCDTYHHFEDPKAMLASIRRALRPGGTLVVVDFERIPGTSPDWILKHVRAGKEDFRREIEASGFRFGEEVKLMRENYFLRFTRD
jgi:predicted methyltransferase